MLRRAGRRLSPAMALLGVLLPLTACGGSVPLPAEGAASHYDDLATELASILAVDGTSWELVEETRTVASSEDACLFAPGTWAPETALPVPSDDAGWDSRIATVNSTILGYGFEQIDGVTEHDSSTVLETVDEHGATLRITAEGDIHIEGATVDADPCTEAALGIA
ncbi:MULTISPECIES: hypothetical protein [Brachybacterium]|uniref:hypothetical protein n=1 Tax=Brachybacterium TaxID=43668 RepID=UPI000BB7F0CF|nr:MULTISPECIES: hypothetical protein [Brachybacterium]PCC31783.1 hypothetical protein CIK71_12475 [Brachybacterium alimentarium]RCS64023.1 hypothetical protein CIK81_10665 [Brachybacterium sp. JB7]RCS71932.1 hypothetical protein CIK73_02120 [Brachybacterium alimentarium]RCS78250.1 hypothetical protein CIK70_11300 [Brachybacterium alimentarium]RCS80036.1 hypothetical protein CIK72_09270 [Brachybacterium alimentarium]